MRGTISITSVLALSFALALVPAEALGSEVLTHGIWVDGNSHEYVVVSFPGKVWDVAQDDMEVLLPSFNLATVTSQEEQDFISDLLSGDGISGQFWLGGFQDPIDEPIPDAGWTWVTQESWVYTNWLDGEPNDGGVGGLEQHLALLGLGWNDEGSLIARITGYIAESGVAHANEFYTLVEPCDLALLDTDLGTTTVIGSTGMAPEGLAFGPDRALYATVEFDLSVNPPVPLGCTLHSNANWLASIDPSTAIVTPIGPIGFPDVDSIAFSCDGTLFGISVRGSTLITIDPITGTGTSIGSISPDAGVVWGFLGALAVLPDGTLVAADMRDGGGQLSRLLTIDPVPGAPDGTYVGEINFESVEGMSVACDGRLYGIAGALEEDPMLIEIDPLTGAGTWVQDIAAPGATFMDGLAALKPGEGCIFADGFESGDTSAWFSTKP